MSTALNFESLFMTGEHRAGNDYKDEGAFHNPYIRNTPEWTGYHTAASKQFRQDLDQSQFEEPY